MSQRRKHTIQGINATKFLLILGVVLIHCNLTVDYPAAAVDSSPSLLTVRFISGVMCRMCVPAFFFLSAFLFFRNIHHFTAQIYISKLRSRINTLLIPYIAWCTIALILLYVKWRFLNMPDDGTFLNNGPHPWLRLLSGYWGRPPNNFPYAFAFWFIRNLITFVILSPLAWIIARHTILTAALFTLFISTGLNLHGFQWFVAGAWLATHHPTLPQPNRRWFIIASIGFWASAITYNAAPLNIIQRIADIPLFISTTYLAWQSGLWISRFQNRPLMHTIIASTFTIYALHQLFSSFTRRHFEQLISTATPLSTAATYIATFLTLIIISFAGYLLMHRFTPRLLNILTGSRN